MPLRAYFLMMMALEFGLGVQDGVTIALTDPHGWVDGID
jgi:hypothetical protein